MFWLTYFVQAYRYLREEVKTFQGKPIKVAILYLLKCLILSVLWNINLNLGLFVGKDKSKANGYQHFSTKEWLQTSWHEPIHSAEVHVILCASHLQPPAAVSTLQPSYSSVLVYNPQLPGSNIGKHYAFGCCEYLMCVHALCILIINLLELPWIAFSLITHYKYITSLLSVTFHYFDKFWIS